MSLFACIALEHVNTTSNYIWAWLCWEQCCRENDIPGFPKHSLNNETRGGKYGVLHDMETHVSSHSTVLLYGLQYQDPRQGFFLEAFRYLNPLRPNRCLRKNRLRLANRREPEEMRHRIWQSVRRVPKQKEFNQRRLGGLPSFCRFD